MVIYELKNGKRLEIRRAEESDASEIINISAIMGGESDNLTFGLEDFNYTESQERDFISDIRRRDNCLFLVGIVNGKIVGTLTFVAPQRKRLYHRGEVGISILKEYWGTGVGSSLMDYFFKWARANGDIKKVELSVKEDNIRAINLYMKFGFKIEGRLSKAFMVSGRYYDIYTMGKIIG